MKKLTAEDAENAEGGRTVKTKGQIDEITEGIIGAAIEVHRGLGPGLLESTYEACLGYELHQRRIAFEAQKGLPVRYKGVSLDCGYRLDIVVADCLILELKACECLTAMHQAQLLTYLKLTGIKTGLLINFNVKVLKEGIKRISC